MKSANWLDACNDEQFIWASKYLRDKKVVGDINFINLKDIVISGDSKLAEDMKRAWNQKLRRKRKKAEGIEPFSVELSKAAHTKLKDMAKKQKSSKDKILQQLVIDQYGYIAELKSTMTKEFNDKKQRLEAEIESKIARGVQIRWTEQSNLLRNMKEKEQHLAEFVPAAERLVKDLSAFLARFNKLTNRVQP